MIEIVNVENKGCVMKISEMSGMRLTWIIFCGVWLALAIDRLIFLVACEAVKVWLGQK